MRTTVDLDPDLHAEAQAEAQRSRVTVSAIVNDALRKSLRPVPDLERDPITGLGVTSVGRRVTAADVADALED